MSERLTQQLSFILKLEELKTITRHNFTLDNGRPENSAEHSWHLAIMAVLLLEHANHSNIDLLKVLKMLLIHDIAEIEVGDTYLYHDEARVAAVQKETDAMKHLTALLPDEQRDEFFLLWQEFESAQTTEAQYAKCIDLFQPVFNHFHITPANHNPNQITAAQVAEKKSFIQNVSPELWELTVSLIEQSRQKGLYL